MLTLDDRQTVSDLKRQALKRVGSFCREMGVPDGPGRVRLSEVIQVYNTRVVGVTFVRLVWDRIRVGAGSGVRLGLGSGPSSGLR